MRAGEYARSALDPFGARLSSLLGCPVLSPLIPFSEPAKLTLGFVFVCFVCFM